MKSAVRRRFIINSPRRSAEPQMTTKLQQFFEDVGTLSEIRQVDRLDNPDLFFTPVPDGFDISVEDRIRFEYRTGTGTTCLCLAGTSSAEIELWFKGSVMGVAAWFNGLIALHVSAVQVGDRLVALAGDSGAGKSTLAAALGKFGFALFADDTLILDRHQGDLVAMPGHKRLKLWDDAFDLVQARRGERLQPGVEKFFADDAGVSSASLLPLTDIVLLAECAGAEPSLRQVTGAEKLKCCADVLYRPELYGQIASDPEHARILLELSGKLRIWFFSRPLDRSLFEHSTKFIADRLAAIGQTRP